MRKNDYQSITIYTTTDFPYGGSGENFVRQMALGLSESNCKLNVIQLRGNYYEQQSNNTIIKSQHILFHKRYHYDILKIIELILLVVLIPFSIINNKLRNKTDIILLYGVEYFYLVLPFIVLSKLFGIKLFRIVTDRYSYQGVAPVWWKRPKYFFYKLQFLYFDRFLSGVICLSSFLKESAIKCGVLEKNICVIPHFIDLDFFANNTDNFTSLANDSIRIGFCGTLNESNGLRILLEAFRIIKEEFSNSKLILIGTIVNDQLNESKEIIMDIADSVIFTGRVAGTRIPELLSSCNILVNPRLSGVLAEAGFPTKLGEYFATKRPVVATAVGDLEYYFSTGEQLVLVKPDSSESLAAGVISLINRGADFSQALGRAGHTWAKENLCYKKNGIKLFEFITH